MKLSLQKHYIFFAFIGWLLLFFLTLAGPKLFMFTAELTNERILYLCTETLLCAFLAYALSFIIALYIDFKIDLNTPFPKVAGPIFIVFLGTQLLYNSLIWQILGYAKLFIEGNDSDMTSTAKWYNVVYFATMYLIWLFVFLTIKIYHQLKTVQLQQLQLESNLRASQLNTLKGQINPHFMFNSLNNIRGLILEDVTKARQMLTNLSETLRYSLTKSNSNAIALEDELEMVQNYIEISKIQFEQRLHFETKIDNESLHQQIPPMIIQMLIENAIKHGISNLKHGGTIQLITRVTNKQLYIEVTNSGTLKNKSNSTQVGLENIKQRLYLLYGNTATFTLSESNNQVIAIIKIPII